MGGWGGGATAITSNHFPGMICLKLESEIYKQSPINNRRVGIIKNKSPHE